MPELPEVETVARGLSRQITGLVIESVHLARKDILHGNVRAFSKALIGKRIEHADRHGKQVHIQLNGDLSLFVHLGMTGRLTVADRDEPIERHTHLRITFRRRRVELRFCDPRRFGGLWLISDNSEKTGKWKGRKLPPVAADPLEVSFTDFRDMLQRDRQIKALLLDQQPLSGIGNIYCDESLHRVGIHPKTKACGIDAQAARRLWQALRKVLKQAIRAGGSSVSDYRDADNRRGMFQVQHRVYQRTGQPCRGCGTPIERLVSAGRGTFICPQCQPMTKTRKKRKPTKRSAAGQG